LQTDLVLMVVAVVSLLRCVLIPLAYVKELRREEDRAGLEREDAE
jgi:hypothetical protein